MLRSGGTARGGWELPWPAPVMRTHIPRAAGDAPGCPSTLLMPDPGAMRSGRLRCPGGVRGGAGAHGSSRHRSPEAAGSGLFVAHIGYGRTWDPDLHSIVALVGIWFRTEANQLSRGDFLRPHPLVRHFGAAIHHGFE